MQEQSYQAKTVLEQLDTKNKTFLVLIERQSWKSIRSLAYSL